MYTEIEVNKCFVIWLQFKNENLATFTFVVKDMFNLKSQTSNSLISRTDKVELIATEFFQQSCNCLGYLEQHTKS